jgi:hypothetical protein
MLVIWGNDELLGFHGHWRLKLIQILCFHTGDVGSVANVSDVYVASIFRAIQLSIYRPYNTVSYKLLSINPCFKTLTCQLQFVCHYLVEYQSTGII